MAERWHLLRVDDRGAWCESVRARATRVWTVYAYRPGSVTHCCELTPSYELVHLGEVAEPHEDLGEADREALHEDVLIGGAQSEAIQYMHCSVVDAIPLVQLADRGAVVEARRVDAGEFGEENDEDKGEDAVREWWNGNPIW